MGARSEQIRRVAEHCSSVTYYVFAAFLRRSPLCLSSASKSCIWNLWFKNFTVQRPLKRLTVK